MPRRGQFKYIVRGAIWLSTGSGKAWSGEVVIALRADCDEGYAALQARAFDMASDWARSQGLSPTSFDMQRWRPVS